MRSSGLRGPRGKAAEDATELACFSKPLEEWVDRNRPPRRPWGHLRQKAVEYVDCFVMSLFNGTLASRYEGGLQRLAGVALPAAAGVTFHTGALNVPVNLAVVPSKSGIRVSVLTGFNMRRE